MTTEPALATVTLDILRPEGLSARGSLRPDGFVELELGTGAPAEIQAGLLANVLAESLHLGPRPLPPASGVLRCDREALDLLLDASLPVGPVLANGFGPQLGPDDEAALRALSGAPVLHWRLRAGWGANASRTCEVVDAGAGGIWRVVGLDDELGGGILLRPVRTTEIWRRLANLLPAQVDLGDG
jgi:hypothetical protein